MKPDNTTVFPHIERHASEKWGLPDTGITRGIAACRFIGGKITSVDALIHTSESKRKAEFSCTQKLLTSTLYAGVGTCLSLILLSGSDDSIRLLLLLSELRSPSHALTCAVAFPLSA